MKEESCDEMMMKHNNNNDDEQLKSALLMSDPLLFEQCEKLRVLLNETKTKQLKIQKQYDQEHLRAEELENRVENARLSSNQRMTYIEALELESSVFQDRLREKILVNSDLKSKSNIAALSSKISKLDAFELSHDAKCELRKESLRACEVEFMLFMERASVHELTSQLQLAIRQCHQYEEDRNAIASSAKTLVERVSFLTEVANALGDERNKLSRSLYTSEKQKESVTKSMSEATETIKKYQEELERTMDETAEARSTKTKLEIERDELAGKLQKTESRYVSMCSSNATLTKQVENHMEMANNQNQLIQDLQSNITQLHLIIKELQQKTVDENILERMVKEQVEENLAKTAKIRKMTSQYETLRRQSCESLDLSRVVDYDMSESTLGDSPSSSTQSHEESCGDASPPPMKAKRGRKPANRKVEETPKQKKQPKAKLAQKSTKEAIDEDDDYTPSGQESSVQSKPTAKKNATRNTRRKKQTEEDEVSKMIHSPNSCNENDTENIAPVSNIVEATRDTSQAKMVTTKKRKMDVPAQTLFSDFVDRDDFNVPKLKKKN